MLNNLSRLNTVIDTVDKVKETADKVKETVDTVIDTVDTVKNLSKGLKKKSLVADDISCVGAQVVEKLSNTPGMIQSRGTKFKKATPKFKLKDGTIIKTYRNSVGVNYVFLADVDGKMIFGGYVYRRHSDEFKITISEIKTIFAASETDTTQATTKPESRGIETRVDITTEVNEQPQVPNDISKVNIQVLEKLVNTPGMTQCRGSHFKEATPNFKLKDGTIIRTYKNSVGVDHVFLADSSGRMLFGGYVGWIHSENLEATIAEIKKTFT
jgi:Rieske Fe-S protein